MILSYKIKHILVSFNTYKCTCIKYQITNLDLYDIQNIRMDYKSIYFFIFLYKWEIKQYELKLYNINEKYTVQMEIIKQNKNCKSNNNYSV